MEKISELFKEFKDRLSSLLFMSFIIAWCFINREVVISLTMYKTEELRLDGYVSYVETIQKKTSTWKSIWKPLLCAVGYTFLYPFIRNFIYFFAANWI